MRKGKKAPTTIFATFQLDILFTYVTHLILREAPYNFLAVTLAVTPVIELE